jgi:hypothetical protein
MRQGIEIKRGAFGLGAFATTAIFPNDYLGGARISRGLKISPNWSPRRCVQNMSESCSLRIIHLICTSVLISPWNFKIYQVLPARRQLFGVWITTSRPTKLGSSMQHKWATTRDMPTMQSRQRPIVKHEVNVFAQFCPFRANPWVVRLVNGEHRIGFFAGMYNFFLDVVIAWTSSLS